MVAIQMAQLAERSLSSGPTDGQIYSQKNAERVRIIATSLACLSILADIVTIYFFARMKRKFRHNLIIMLVTADLLKDINYIAFTAVSLIHGGVPSDRQYCQASGFFQQFLVEITDFVILAIVVHLSVQILNPKATASSEGGLHAFQWWIYSGIIGLPFLMACLAFTDPHGGYQLVGAFCALPVRPFWYRLALSWVPRYMIVITILVLTVIIRLKVKGYQAKLEELQQTAATQAVIEEGIIEENEESDNDSEEVVAEKPLEPITPIEEKRSTVISTAEIPPVPPLPAEHQQFSAGDLRKFKRMSYKRRNLPPINTAAIDNTPRGNSVAASVAPSSAVFASPTRSEFGNTERPNLNRNSKYYISRESDTPSPTRRKSIADFNPRRSLSVMEIPSTPNRRGSMIESGSQRGGSASAANADRLSSVQSSRRRSSIWDEIDAGLEKKVTTNNNNRISIFTITASEADGTYSHDDAPVVYECDQIAISARNSMVFPPAAAPQQRNSILSPSANPQRNSAAPLPYASYPGDRTSFAGPLNSHRLYRAQSRHSATTTSNRGSVVYNIARRTMSVISLRGMGMGGGGDGDNEPADSPGAILRRRHRYIQRQLRYLTFYPVLYLLLWACPFLLHVLQYDDRFARRAPLVVAVLSVVSMTVFGAVNSLVFCLREKPWTAIPDTDGTLSGAMRSCPVYLFGRGLCWTITGRGRRLGGEEGEEEEEDMDF